MANVGASNANLPSAGADAAPLSWVLVGPVVPQYGRPALVLAVEGGHLDVVRLLLDRGANLEAKVDVSASCRLRQCRHNTRLLNGERGRAPGRALCLKMDRKGLVAGMEDEDWQELAGVCPAFADGARC